MNDDTASWLHLIGKAYWLQDPDELMENRNSSKKTTRLSLTEAGCPVSSPDEITSFFQLRHAEDELELMSIILRNYPVQ